MEVILIRDVSEQEEVLLSHLVQAGVTSLIQPGDSFALSFRQSTKGPVLVSGSICVLDADLAWSFSCNCPSQCLVSAPRPTVAKPLETVMPAHTLAWYLDLYQSLH